MTERSNDGDNDDLDAQARAEKIVREMLAEQFITHLAQVSREQNVMITISIIPRDEGDDEDD